jgi:ABC-type amino acid transport substrate-binding protein
MTREQTHATGRRAAVTAKVCLALFAVVGVCLAGADEQASAQSDDLVVVAYEAEPFLTRTGDVPGGVMYEVWTQVAALEGWSYEVVWADSLDDLADSLEAGEADVALAPLSSTSERERRFEFTS